MDKFEASPLVVDGVMYFSQPPSDVIAVDARTGRAFWTYRYTLAGNVGVCCGRVNRGLAILGDTLFLAALDGNLVALDAKTGKEVWKTRVVDPSLGYSLTMAPLVVKDKVIIGPAGGEYGIRGFLAAFDARTGKEVWRFNTIPEPGEAGHETWAGDAWQRGGGSVWLTGSYDPELNLIVQGVGNPGPDWNATVRPGDNLYSSSVIALDADTGKLKWHYQFVPHDAWDWDAMQTPVMVDAEWQGRAAQAAVLGASRRRFLRAGPDQRKVSVGQAVREGELAGGLRRKRASEARTQLAADGGRDARFTRACRAARTGMRPRIARGRGCSTCRYGPTTTRCTRRATADYVAGRRYNGGNIRQPLAFNRNAHAASRRRTGIRGPEGDRPEDRGDGVAGEVRGPDRGRRAQHGRGRGVHGQPGRILPCLRRARREAAVEGLAGRLHRGGSGELLGGRETVRSGGSGARDVCVRAAGVTRGLGQPERRWFRPSVSGCPQAFFNSTSARQLPDRPADVGKFHVFWLAGNTARAHPAATL